MDLWSRSSFNTVSSNSNQKKPDDSKDLASQFAPRLATDLVLQKSKLDQLKAWLEQAEESREKLQKVPFLVITGPPGCGKATALRVLAAAQNYDVCEWITPVDIEDYRHGSGNLVSTQATQFEEFLFRCGRYLSVIGKERKRLIFVKDFPNLFLMQRNILHDILRNYSSVGRYPVVFCILEESEGFNTLFPNSIVEELNIHQISFNKVPNKSIQKCLQNICSSLGNSALSKSVLQCIADNALGDLRNAIVQLSVEYSRCKTQHLTKLPHKQETAKSKTKVQRGKRKADQSSTDHLGKDEVISIFHKVGRLLYPKRNDETGENGEFSHDPEEIVQQSLSQPHRLFNMVYENYLKILVDINSINRAITYASDVDIMMSEYRDRSATLPMALSTLVRAFMTTKRAQGTKWTPLTNKELPRVKLQTKKMYDSMLNYDPRCCLFPRDAFCDRLPVVTYRNLECGTFVQTPDDDGQMESDEENYLLREVSSTSQRRGGILGHSVTSQNIQVTEDSKDDSDNIVIEDSEDEEHNIEFSDWDY